MVLVKAFVIVLGVVLAVSNDCVDGDDETCAEHGTTMVQKDASVDKGEDQLNRPVFPFKGLNIKEVNKFCEYLGELRKGAPEKLRKFKKETLEDAKAYMPGFDSSHEEEVQELFLKRIAGFCGITNE